MSKAVIIGGGIASLYASALLAEQGYAVTVVEREPAVGGLLNSKQNEQGDWFDHGTHFIAGTNNPDIDRIVLPDSATAEWQHFSNEWAGNVFAGEYSPRCLFADTRALPAAEYERGIADYLATSREEQAAANLDEQLIHRFGPGFAQSVFGPAMHKFFGTASMQDLTPDAHLRFGMKRLKAFSADETRQHKLDPHHDDRLCFHEFDEGNAARAQYYPKAGGSGEWIAALVAEAAGRGVEFRTSTTMTGVETDGRTITAVELADGERLECDQLIWTVPLFPLLRALDIRAQGGPPTLRHTTLFHLVFDRAPVPQDHFYFNFDPAYLCFRATLYSNLQPHFSEAAGRHRITVETLTSEALSIDDVMPRIEAELRHIGTVPADAKLLAQSGDVVREGFPVLDHAFAAAKQAQMDAVTGRFDNLVLAGRSCTPAWFMHEVFTDVWTKLSVPANAMASAEANR